MSVIDTAAVTAVPIALWKAVFDKAFSLLALLLLLPFGLLVALLIVLDNRGRVFYRQTRIGQAGRPYQIFKFRTMVAHADKLGPALTATGDTRITRIGRLLRRMSIDEIPQLINVLRGEMSIVGPRPEIPEIVRTYTKAQFKALQVRPGITGLTQVNGRDDLPLPEKLVLDARYVDTLSPGMDLAILLKTIPAIISGKGNRY